MAKRIWSTWLVGFMIGIVAGSLATYAWLVYREDAGWFIFRAGHDGMDDHSCVDHEEHDEQDEHNEGRITLSEEAIRQFGIEVAPAGGGKLEQTLKLPAEIALNADRVAHLVPRVAGMAREVCKNVGDEVSTGELMAVLESRELAEVKAADLAAEARLKLAESNFKRVEELLRKNIAPEQEYFEALQKLEEERIAHHETVAKLHALGLNHDELDTALTGKEAEFSRYEIRAPFAGTVVAKHIALGELHDSSSDVFLLADLSTVWVDITVYAQDTYRIRPGQKIRLSSPARTSQAVEGEIFYVSPIIRESTRTGLARAVLANDKGLWKPGLFVAADIVLGKEEVDLLVPSEAIQWVEEQSVIFVAADGAFQKRPVAIGEKNGTHVHIVSGLNPGERFVARGASILKAELLKGTGGHEH